MFKIRFIFYLFHNAFVKIATVSYKKERYIDPYQDLCQKAPYSCNVDR